MLERNPSTYKESRLLACESESCQRRVKTSKMVSSIATLWLFASSLGLVLAHPGHDVTAEVNMRRSYLASLKNRGLEHCTVKLKQNKIEDLIIARRQAMVKHVRMKRGLEHHEGMSTSTFLPQEANEAYRHAGEERLGQGYQF